MAPVCDAQAALRRFAAGKKEARREAGLKKSVWWVAVFR
jgi:hypothetical protein